MERTYIIKNIVGKQVEVRAETMQDAFDKFAKKGLCCFKREEYKCTECSCTEDDQRSCYECGHVGQYHYSFYKIRVKRYEVSDPHRRDGRIIFADSSFEAWKKYREERKFKGNFKVAGFSDGNEDWAHVTYPNSKDVISIVPLNPICW